MAARASIISGQQFCQCQLQHLLLLTGQTGKILSVADRFFDQKENSWKSPRSHVALTMDNIIVRMASDNSAEERLPQYPVSRRRTVLIRQSSVHSKAGIRFKDCPDESTYILTILWSDVVWVTGDRDRNGALKVTVFILTWRLPIPSKIRVIP